MYVDVKILIQFKNSFEFLDGQIYRVDILQFVQRYYESFLCWKKHHSKNKTPN